STFLHWPQALYSRQRIEVDLPGAVAELVDPDARLVEQAHQQIPHRDIVAGRKREMASAFEPAGSAARNDQRQVDVQMHVRVTHRPAIEQEAVVEEVAIAVRSGAQLLEEVCEQLRVPRIDARIFLELCRLVAMMAQPVMRLCK